MALCVSLDEAASAELEQRYQTTHDAETRTRYQMVLLCAQGYTAPGRHADPPRPDAVRRVVHRYLAGGPDGVPRRSHPGQWGRWPAAWEAELARVAEADPSGPAPPGRGQCAVDLAAAGRLPGRGHRHRAGIETVRMALNRVWSRTGWSGQRLIQAPGTNRKQYGFGLVDWRDGRLDFGFADGSSSPRSLKEGREAWAGEPSRTRPRRLIGPHRGAG
jgi:hypothetical protein